MRKQFNQTILSAQGMSARDVKMEMYQKYWDESQKNHKSPMQFYVGISNDMDANYSRHKNDEFCGFDFSYLCIYECDNAEIAAEVEKLMADSGFDCGGTETPGNGGVKDSVYVYMFEKE